MKKIHYIILMISVLTLALIASTSVMRRTSAQTTTPAYAISPATTELGPGSEVGQNFTVTLILNGTDATNAPQGIAGIEVHVNWNSSLIVPLSYTDLVGSTGGVFNGTDPSQLLSTAKGFYLQNQTKLTSPPYDSAFEFYEVYASTTGSPWWGSGTIASITFNVTQQPTPFATCPIFYNFTDLVDLTENPVTHNNTGAAVVLTTLTANPENVSIPWDTTQSPFTIGISTDSNLTAPTNLGFTNSSSGAEIDFNATTYGDYTGTCNVTIPNNLMWNASGTDDWVVMVDNASAPNSVAIHDATNEYIWVNFTSGTHMITIEAQNYVPEFTATSLMFVLMATMLVATATAATLRKRKLHL